MHGLNTKRAIGFGLIVYALSFVLYLITAAFFEIDPYEMPGTGVYAISWLLMIPLVLIPAKWYFKKDEPTTKKGFWLGVMTIIVAFVVDGIFILMALLAGQDLSGFEVLYTDWRFWVSIVEIIALCTYAGYEFDKTYTAPDKKA